MLDDNFNFPRARQKPPQIQSLQDDVINLQKAFAQLEKAKMGETIPRLKRVIHEAFLLTGSGAGLPSRLRALGFPESLLDTRDVREIGKVSNYWRVSRHLAVCSRRFRSCFEEADWRPVHNYKASTSSRSVPKQYVHAEIQLLVHFESQSGTRMPRAIGVSKEACFLCDSFIRAHGRFAITGAHRQMYPQWTIPDLEEYSSQTVEHFRAVLSCVFGEVRREYLEAHKKRLWKPFPLQSAVNLYAVQFSTPSASTLPLRSETRDGVDVISGAPSSSTGDTNEQCHTEKCRKDDVQVPGTAEAEAAQDQMHPDLTSRSEEAVPVEVTVHQDLVGRVDWIRAFASFSSSKGVSTSPGASLSLEPVSENGCARTIYLADLLPGAEILLARDESDPLGELDFVLAGHLGRRVLFRCRWH